eukprot:8267106-Alexandrium_andersonii.AAC.1
MEVKVRERARFERQSLPVSRDVLCPRIVFDAWLLLLACDDRWNPGGPRPPLNRGHQRGCKATSMAQGPE